MFSIHYKGHSIQGHFDQDAVRIVTPDHRTIKAKSLHAAKCIITRTIKAN